ncbi:ABC transporter permease [Bifidobacterium scaligerum]|uniref:ABC transporter permease n=1 Tax=Bifidobacterium scaligerum TaxID=2052656 RepID=A0A2M9HST0_9BIFI|nr:ABC transporter permease [Bifidobacterium scaligerum]
MTDHATVYDSVQHSQRRILRTLAARNLVGRPMRTGALLAVVTILALAFFGGTMLTMNLNTGMASMERRLGADLMVVPQNTAQKAEALLTDGNPSTFYFTKDIADEVKKADGIDQASEQTYIASLAAECCAEKLQIIGYDPSTDFVIEPWVASQFDGTLEDGQMIAGANVNVSADGTVELYGHKWPVVAQLASTGTSLDNSVFINLDTVPQMVEASAKVAKRVMPAEYADKAVSTVLIKVSEGYGAETVAENIKRLDSRFSDLGYVYPGGVTATTKTALNALVAYLTVFVAAIWVMGVIVLLAVFAASVNERKREFASLRILGATRGMLAGILLRESALIGLIGGAFGVGLASLAIFPFSALIGKQLQLPYLQASVPTVLAIMAVTLVCSVAIGVAGSLAVLVRIGRPEAYLTLREGE